MQEVESKESVYTVHRHPSVDQNDGGTSKYWSGDTSSVQALDTQDWPDPGIE